MKYMGSKARYAKDILPIILKGRKEKQYFVDLFCGGCNLIDKVSGLRIANDSHYYLIEMFKALQNGWIPPEEVTEEKYLDCKKYPALNYPYLVGYVGFNCSYSGKWFGGYAGKTKTKTGQIRDYQKEAHNNVMNQVKNLANIIFYNCDYREVIIPQNSVVYCDPPYFATTKYSSLFNHEDFWDYMRKLSQDGYSCFISEYSAPDDFDCVWEKTVASSLSANGKSGGNKVSVEKLFVYKG